MQPWWIWLDANQRSATVNRPTQRAVLYTSSGLIAPMPSSETARRNAPHHARFHGSHVEVFDHDVAVGARQLGGELVGGFPP